MNPSHVIAHFRRRETQLMTSTCTITRGSGTPVWNPTTGTYDDPGTTIYTGVCRLAAPNRQASDVEAAAATYALTDYVVTLPITTDARVDDKVTINASDDPIAAGLVLIVEAVPKSDWQVARKAHCREYTQEPT